MRTSKFVLALSQKCNIRCEVALGNPPKSRHRLLASCRVTSVVAGGRNRGGRLIRDLGCGSRS